MAFKYWSTGFRKKVKGVFAFGEASLEIWEALKGKIFIKVCTGLEEAIKEAYLLAQEGDKILFSPGCSSLDQFKDYQHRGKEFERIIAKL